jgi:hypothetical protein
MRPRLFFLLAIVLSAVGLSACGEEEEPFLRAETEAAWIEVGGLRYQVQISRPLNPGMRSDAELLSGLPEERQQLPADTTWFGVFVRVENETERPLPSSVEFTIEDTQGNTYEPIPVDNLVAYRPELLPPGRRIPNEQSVAAFGQTQGAFLLFQLPVATLDNRPLELLVQSPDGQTEGSIDLDI